MTDQTSMGSSHDLPVKISDDGFYRLRVKMENCVVINMAHDGMIRRLTWWQQWMALGQPDWMLRLKPAIWTTNPTGEG